MATSNARGPLVDVIRHGRYDWRLGSGGECLHGNIAVPAAVGKVERATEMAWLVVGLAIVVLGPCAGAAAVAALVAWHEARRAWPALPPHRLTRRAPTGLLEEYLDDLAAMPVGSWRRRSGFVYRRRADPEVLYEFLAQRAAAAPPRPANLATRLAGRAPRAVRLLPLTA